MADVFISYKREDRARVLPIIALLEWRGWSVWWDPHIVPGEAFRDTIEREIGQADCVLVAWSPASVQSNWVRDEAQVGAHRNILVPVIVEPCVPPMGFQQIQAADLTRWNGAKSAVEADALANGVAMKVGRLPADRVLQPIQVEPPVSLSVREAKTEGKQNDIVLGVALDVSGSMSQSIRNDNGPPISRLRSVQNSVERMATSIAERVGKDASVASNVTTFAIAYGLRYGDIADLISLKKAAEALDLNHEIKKRRDRYEAEARQSAGHYSGLAGLARSYGFGGLVDSAVAAVKDQVKTRIAGEIAGGLQRKANEIGRSFATASELAAFFEEFSNAKDSDFDVESLIFGVTPMLAAARAVADTFRSLPASRERKENRLLLVISDGESTDGDPSEIFQEIRALGVTIVSCFVSGHDVADPRRLYSEPQAEWENGARLMFDIASTIPEHGEFARYLRDQGWAVTPHSKLFIQSNHSVVLDEFIHVMSSHFGEPTAQRDPGE